MNQSNSFGRMTDLFSKFDPLIAEREAAGKAASKYQSILRKLNRGVQVRQAGMIRRQCTGDYKIEPIRRKVREMLGLTRRRSPESPIAEQWIGISLDEALRMKPSFEPWQINRWPLVEHGMTRLDCLRWLARHDYPPPPKSACIGCPFHSDDHWRDMRDHDPQA